MVQFWSKNFDTAYSRFIYIIQKISFYFSNLQVILHIYESLNFLVHFDLVSKKLKIYKKKKKSKKKVRKNKNTNTKFQKHTLTTTTRKHIYNTYLSHSGFNNFGIIVRQFAVRFQTMVPIT